MNPHEMKPTGKENAFAGMMADVAVLPDTPAQQYPTTGSIDSHLGRPGLENGYPAEARGKLDSGCLVGGYVALHKRPGFI